MKTSSVLALLAVLSGLAAVKLPAQLVISAQAGMINSTEGMVLLGDSVVQLTNGRFPQMKPQDVLSTSAGWAEVLLNPGSFVRLGENSSIRLVSDSLTHPAYELLGGASVLEMAAGTKDASVTIHWKDVTISPVKRGVFRVDANPASLRVFEGEARVLSGGQRLTVGKGRMLLLDGTWAMTRFDSKQTDDLDRWSGQRATYLAMVNMRTAEAVSGRRGSGGLWGWSSLYGIYTYIPYSGMYRSFYGCRFYSPQSLAEYNRPTQQPSSSFDSGGTSPASAPSYATNTATSTGTSGTIAASSPASTTESSASSAPISRDAGNAGGRTR